MKRLILTIFVSSLFFGNFCPMNTMNHVKPMEHAMHSVGMNHCDVDDTSMVVNPPCSGSDCFMNNYISGQKMTSLAKTGTEPVAYTGVIAIEPFITTSIITLSSHSPTGGPPIPLDQNITTIVMRT